jgi:hypothetical protein
MKYRQEPDEILFEETYISIVIQKQLIPTHLVPFAIGGGGDFYCMNLSTQAIVFYAMDHCFEPNRAIEPVADSLAQFLDEMVTEDKLP